MNSNTGYYQYLTESPPRRCRLCVPSLIVLKTRGPVDNGYSTEEERLDKVVDGVE